MVPSNLVLSSFVMASLESIQQFGSILEEVIGTNAVTRPPGRRLRFTNQSLQAYEKTERDLVKFFEDNLSADEFRALNTDAQEQLDEESRLCDLIIHLIGYCENLMDQQVDLFQEVLNTVHQVQEMDFSVSDNGKFAESAVNKTSLLIYDTFQIMRSARKRVIEVARVYHVPYCYETRQFNYRLRSSLLTTYKNLNTVMDDFGTLNDALWYVRHFDSMQMGG